MLHSGALARRGPAALTALLAIALAAAGARPAPAVEAEDAPVAPGQAVAQIRSDSAKLKPLVRTRWVKGFLEATAALPPIAPRPILSDEARAKWWSEAEAQSLPAGERAALVRRVLDEEFYYNTRYGTPLAYARPLDLLGAAGFAPARRTILDFGFGGIGQLRLLASLGARVHGVEVDPMTRALYAAAGDQGPVPGYRGPGGTVALHYGRWPADAPIAQAAGDSLDLFLSKNTLKRGYIHPEQPVPDRQRIDLGVSDEDFVRALAAHVKPGGFVMIYNLTPAPNAPGKPYVPWADGRCPFARGLFEANGFRVIDYDRDDSAAARAMARALGWDRAEGGGAGMDLENDLFALYTLARRVSPP